MNGTTSARFKAPSARLAQLALSVRLVLLVQPAQKARLVLWAQLAQQAHKVFRVM